MKHKTSTGVDNLKLGMWAVIASECMLFGGLIINYLISANRINLSTSPEVIKPIDIFNIPLTSASTFVLLASSLTMVLSLSGIQRNNLKSFRIWCLITAIAGTVFLGIQAIEFAEFYHAGMGLTVSPFASAFFVLTGTHGAHVFVGVILLVTFLLWSLSNKIETEKHAVVLETIGLYWHFVDVVWIVIFNVVYLFALAP